jgi:osomolarity two-component system, sensor histidine kinase NIK1
VEGAAVNSIRLRFDTDIIALQGLLDNVNLMAMNLTNQVRSIAEVTKAVAGGDLTKRITVDVRGEMLDLKDTVNGMTESLSVFADEVTRVAKEVGTDGKLGGQARVTNVSGTWKVCTIISCLFCRKLQGTFRT